MSGPGAGELSGDWDYSTLPENVRLGRGCYLEDRNVFSRFRSELPDGLVLGDGVRVYATSALSCEPTGRIEVGAGSVLVGAIFWCQREIVLGRDVLVSYNVMLADSDFHPTEPEERRLDALAVSPAGDAAGRPPFASAPVVLEDGVRVGAGAMVLKGVTVGAGASVGAGAVVVRDVPPGAFVLGNPARVVREVP